MHRISKFSYLSLLLPILFSVSTYAAQFEKKDTSINLRSGKLVLSPSTTEQALEHLQSVETDGIHVVIKTKGNLTIEQRNALKEKGVAIIDPFGHSAYIAKLSKNFTPDDKYHRDLIVNIAQFSTENKVVPEIWSPDQTEKKFIIRPRDEDAYNYVLNADGTMNLTVQFYRGVPKNRMIDLLTRYSEKHAELSDTFWEVTVSRENMYTLAGEDIVQWIDAAPMPFLPDNDISRGIINVDPVQNFNVATGITQGLGGQNVDIGIFDSGVDNNHNDFTTTLVNNAGTGGALNRASHGTHVAGIALGNGSMSNQNDSWGNNNNGTPFQWRGMAPQADLIDAPSSDSRNAANYLSYIATNGMDVSNHSYSLSFDGAYNLGNVFIDQAIQGSATSGGVAIPRRLQTFSAGNHGNFPFNGGNQIGYFSITKQMKNALIVGNYDVGNDRISLTSSLGPTNDGRIKPDVVAPGSNVTSAGFCPSCPNPAVGANQLHRNYYLQATGTSMAAPAVTGALGLVLQRWAAKFGVNLDNNPPWPSTLRAIVIHSARDLASPVWFDNEDAPVQAFSGPDFVTGWGMLDASAAINVIDSHRIIEDNLPNTCDQKKYKFYIGPRNNRLIKATLAWDDVSAAANAVGTTAALLINDLDLELIDPNGTVHYPWLLNQTTVNQLGNAVANNVQSCGSALNTQTDLQPTLNPVFVAPNNPNNVNDPIQAAALKPAVFGKDHLNNVEMAPAQPTSGWWEAKVTGFNIAQGPQNFSLILPWSFVLIRPINICDLFPGLCPIVALPRVCKKYPQLCQTQIVIPGEKGPIINFRHKQDKVIIPMDRICQYVVDCPGCAQAGYCPAYSVVLDGMPDAFRIELFDSEGKRLFRDVSASRTKKLHFKAEKDKSYFVIVTPGKDTDIGKQYELPLRIQ